MASREPHHVFTYEEYLARERENRERLVIACAGMTLDVDAIYRAAI